MNKEELYTRGQMSVDDATFIRDRFISLAVRGNRWNIVVYEAYRVIELLLKGIICFSGYTPY